MRARDFERERRRVHRAGGIRVRICVQRQIALPLRILEERLQIDGREIERHVRMPAVLIGRCLDLAVDARRLAIGGKCHVDPRQPILEPARQLPDVVARRVVVQRDVGQQRDEPVARPHQPGVCIDGAKVPRRAARRNDLDVTVDETHPIDQQRERRARAVALAQQMRHVPAGRSVRDSQRRLLDDQVVEDQMPLDEDAPVVLHADAHGMHHDAVILRQRHVVEHDVVEERTAEMSDRELARQVRRGLRNRQPPQAIPQPVRLQDDDRRQRARDEDRQEHEQGASQAARHVRTPVQC